MDIIEKEINLGVKDKESLLKYLRNMAQEEIKKVAFVYFNHPTDKSFYLRIEDRLTERSKVLTVKVQRSLDENNIKSRREITVNIEDISSCVDIALIVGLESSGRKCKIRHSFSLSDAQVDVDEWFWRDDFQEYIECRVEIESDNEQRILEIAKDIESFTTQ